MRLPELAVDADPPVRPAWLDNLRRSTNQPLGTRHGAPPPGEVDPEPCLSELDRQPRQDCDETPVRRQDEDCEQDREQSGHQVASNTPASRLARTGDATALRSRRARDTPYRPRHPVAGRS